MVAFGAAIECGALFIINQEKRVASFTGATNHHAGSSRATCAYVGVCMRVCVRTRAGVAVWEVECVLVCAIFVQRGSGTCMFSSCVRARWLTGGIKSSWVHMPARRVRRLSHQYPILF